MSYETNLIDYINLLERSANTRPLVLGGITSSGGGDGGPPGGFVGYLPQTRISYDLTELATIETAISGESLLDNLNHIRYRLDLVESSGGSGGGHVIQDSGIPFTQRDILNFVGAGVIVSDDAGNNATIVTITAAGGGGNSGQQIDQAGGTEDTFGILYGDRNGVNTEFIVSLGSYDSGTLNVFLNGQLLTQGSSEDWHEYIPASGTFHFTTAPEVDDEITAIYGGAGIGEAPIDGTPYARQDGGWVEVTVSGVANEIDPIFVASEAYGFETGDKAKLDGIEVGANLYVLPTASDTILGGIKVGYGLDIAAGVLAVDLFAGHMIQDEGVNKTSRTNLNFEGDGVTVTDDAGNDATVVTISISGGSNPGGPPGFQILTPGTTIDWDLSDGSARVTISGEMTMNNPTNLGEGEHYFLSVVQSPNVGTNTLLWDDLYKFADNTPPTLSIYKGREDIIPFECDGTYMYGMGIVKNLTNQALDLEYLTNLVLWFKADAEVYSDNGSTLCTNGDTVYRWDDQSGNSFDATQTTAGNRPTYRTNIIGTKPAIDFDGVDNVLAITSDLDGTGDDLSFFIVIVPDDTAPIGIFDSGDEDSIRNFSTGQWDWFSGSPYVDMDLGDTNPVLLEFIHTMAPNRAITYYKNGTWVSDNPTGDSSTTLWETLAAIGSINFGYDYYDGDIAEFILYKEAVGTTTRQDIETYLKAKYGIA